MSHTIKKKHLDLKKISDGLMKFQNEIIAD